MSTITDLFYGSANSGYDFIEDWECLLRSVGGEDDIQSAKLSAWDIARQEYDYRRVDIPSAYAFELGLAIANKAVSIHRDEKMEYHVYVNGTDSRIYINDTIIHDEHDILDVQLEVAGYDKFHSILDEVKDCEFTDLERDVIKKIYAHDIFKELHGNILDMLIDAQDLNEEIDDFFVDSELVATNTTKSAVRSAYLLKRVFDELFSGFSGEVVDVDGEVCLLTTLKGETFDIDSLSAFWEVFNSLELS